MAGSSTSSTETEISNEPAAGGQPVMDKKEVVNDNKDQDDQVLDQLYYTYVLICHELW